jgi:Ni2+-binding GTPase involved in maturation of urease and hydrogenase
MGKARYIMLGGFLGAGKTTAVLKLAEHLTAQGLTVGLITNDQSFGLVDTTMLGAHGFPVEEITGGCFCCKFNSLLEASERLSTAARPDVFIAEPVGSCTDLRASVSYPLRRIYGDDFTVAPLSVLVDPIRARRIMGLDAGKSFSSKVLYVYEKQLEEAEAIVVNKCDLLPAESLEELCAALAARFPTARLFTVSARDGSGLEPWFDVIATDELVSVPAMEVDYELYAEGEALLGWFNCTLTLDGDVEFDGNQLLRDLAGRVQRRLTSEELEIAHLKMTFTPDEDGGDIGVLNLVRNEGQPEMSHLLREPVEGGQLIINLRAEGDPDALKAAALDAMAQATELHGGARVTIEHVEHFRPGKPVPTYRLTTA